MKPIIGIDIGGTKCAVVLARVNQGVDIIDKIRFETPPEFEAAIKAVYHSIDKILLTDNVIGRDVQAIGISCGGPLDSRAGVILCPPNLPGWLDVPIVDMLRERYGVPVFLQNDANACALAEWKFGAGQGSQDMIFLTMGTGMGAGIIAEGRLVRGHTDMGGEVGHIRLAENGPVGFGKAGSFEGFTSGGGIARQAQALTSELVADGRPPQWALDGIDGEDITAKAIAGYARAEDPDALELFRRVGMMLGKGIAALVDTLNPERVVIGSIFARSEDLLRGPMEAALKAEAIPYSTEKLSIVPAQLGEALGDYASVVVAAHGLDTEPWADARRRSPRVDAHAARLVERYPILTDTLPSVIEAYELIRDSFAKGGKLLICGNGGSCADALHIVGELMKGFMLPRPLPEDEATALQAHAGEGSEWTSRLQRALPTIALTEHSSLNTAFANDVDASLMYAQQVVGYGRPGDVLLGISTSGNARNVRLAAKTAKARGLTVVGLTGRKGGLLASDADVTIRVPADATADVQELHLPVYHTLCAMLEEYFFG